MKKSKLFITAALCTGVAFTAASCGHEHTYSDSWTTDATYHWHVATCGDTEEVKDKAEHTFGDDNFCDVCGYEKQDDPTTYKDVTITVNATGISEYTGKHAALWINTTIGGTGDGWASYKMTQDETDSNKWSYTFSSVETDNTYKYNIYYGSDGEDANSCIDWSNGKNTGKEGQDACYSVQVTDETYTFTENVAFSVPSVAYSFTVTITPVFDTAATIGQLYDTNSVYMWDSASGNTVALTDNGDGTWSYDVEDYYGTQYSCTPVLGKSEADWSYQFSGAINASGGFEEYTSAYYWTLGESTEADGLSLTAYFASQPAKPSAEAKDVEFTFNLSWTDTMQGNPSVIIYSDSSHKAPSVDGTWVNLTDWTSGPASGNKTISLAKGDKVYFVFYNWHSNDDIRFIAYSNDGTSFVYTVGDETSVSISATGSFGSDVNSIVEGSYTTE